MRTKRSIGSSVFFERGEPETMYLVHQNQTGIQYLLDALACSGGSRLPQNRVDFAICWSRSDSLQAENSRTHFWLNHPNAVREMNDAERVRSILQLNGIATYLDHSRPTLVAKRKLSIAVCNLRPLAVFAGQRRVNRQMHNKACQLAVQSVQALQLDFALVHVVITNSGSPQVEQVDPTPNLSRPLARIFAMAMLQFAKYWRLSASASKERIVLGADVEFILLTPQGKVSPASLYLPRYGVVGYDALRLNRKQRLFPIVELRPRPARTPEQLFRHIVRTMQVAARKINRQSLRWVAGAMPLRRFAIGGHLHISNFWLNSVFLRALDRYLALPLMMCESFSSVKRRLKYGRISDFRRQFHGGFEYRSLPSWIVDPKLALSVLALFYTLAVSYRQLPLRSTIRLSDERLQRAFYTGDKSTLMTLVSAGWNELDELSEYKNYRQLIEPLRRQSLQMQEWAEDEDVRKAWRITPFHR